jgi:hypothetical protein
MSEKSLLSPHSISPGPFQQGVQHPKPSLKANMDIVNVPLREPSRSHDRELLPQLPHALRGIRNNDDGLLYSRSSHIRRTVDKQVRVELS